MSTSEETTTHIKRSSTSKAKRGKKSPRVEITPELVAALRALPNPTTDVPPRGYYEQCFLAFRNRFNDVVRARLPEAGSWQAELISKEISRRWTLVKDAGGESLWTEYSDLSKTTFEKNKGRAAKRDAGATPKPRKGSNSKKAAGPPAVLSPETLVPPELALETPPRERSSGKARRTLPRQHAPSAILPIHAAPVVAPPTHIAPSAPRFEFSNFVSPTSARANAWSPYGPTPALSPAQCTGMASLFNLNYGFPGISNSAPVFTLPPSHVYIPTSPLPVALPYALSAAPATSPPLAFTDFNVNSGPDFPQLAAAAAGETVPFQGSLTVPSPHVSVVIPSLPAGSSGAVAQAPSISSPPAPAYHPTPPLPVFYSGRLHEPVLSQLSAASEFDILPPEGFIENLLASGSSSTQRTSFTVLPAAEEEWDFFLPPTDWNAQALPQSPNANLLGLFDLDLAATAKP